MVHHFRKNLIKIALAIILCTASLISQSQEVLLNSVTEVGNDISAREHEVIDANGDASALIKARISLSDIRFLTDLGINKTEEKDGEVWLWVPPGTSTLTLINDSKDTIDVKLPGFLEEYSVCVVLFTVVLPSEIQVLDRPTLTFNTTPNNADIFVNDLHQGKSPVSIGMLPDTFTYRIEKKRYHSITGIDYMPDKSKIIDQALQKSDTSNRWFLQVSTDLIIPHAVNGGLSFGILGRTGWYFNVTFPLKKTSRDFYLRPETQFNGISSEYIQLDPIKKVIEHKHFVLGITQSLSDGIFVSGGLGLATSKTYVKYKRIPYDTDLPESVVYGFDKNAYVQNAVALDLGLLIRIKNRLLLSLNITSLIDKVYNTETDDSDKIKSVLSDIKIGLGYSF